MADLLNVNFFAGAGYLVEDAQFFATRRGRPKVVFRMRLPRDPRLPKKKPEGCDFYSVVALGDRFVSLLDHLLQDTPVVVVGYVQSRDVTVDGCPRIVSEIGAQAIYLVREPENEGGVKEGGVAGEGGGYAGGG